MKNKLTIAQIRKIIREEADIIIDEETPAEVQPREDAFSGGENLSHSIDIADATIGLETVNSPETLSITDDRGVYRMTETRLRKIVQRLFRKR